MIPRPGLKGQTSMYWFVLSFVAEFMKLYVSFVYLFGSETISVDKNIFMVCRCSFWDKKKRSIISPKKMIFREISLCGIQFCHSHIFAKQLSVRQKCVHICMYVMGGHVKCSMWNHIMNEYLSMLPILR